MSEINSSRDAWNKFKLLAQQVSGANNITDADIKNLIKKADVNGDDLVSQEEFKDSLLTYEDYIKVEDSYLDAFNAIAMNDGEEGSISDKDISSIFDGIDKAMNDANLNSKLGYLSSDSVTNNTINILNDLSDTDSDVFLDIKASKLNSSGVKKLNNAGFKYGVWTVNDTKKIVDLEELGCITLTSDVVTQKDIERLL